MSGGGRGGGNEPTLIERLSRFATDIAAAGPPADVRRSVRQRVLDQLGICIAASALDTSEAVRRYVAAQGGRPESQAVGLPERVPAALASLLNGTLGHSLDYDDTHLPSVLHPSASVVPASLAACEAAGADGNRLVAAIAVGLEICVRLGMAGYDPAARNSTFFDRGQHATSICGAIASAASAGIAFSMGEAEIGHAMSIACSMAAGIIESNRTGGTVKRIHCGWAAHAGISAAQLARAGITGSPSALEGRFGFFQAFLSGHFDEDAVTGGLGDSWEVPGIFFKPYPANHFTHAGIDAAMALRERGLRPRDVDELVLGVADPTVRTIGEPIEQKRAPETGYQAQFSGPYTVVAGLLGGEGLGVGLADFTDELARDPERRALMAKVSVVADPRCDAIFPRQFPATLRARTRSGEQLEEVVLANRGGNERPLSDEDLAAKFRDNARLACPSEVIEEIVELVGRLEELDDVGACLAPLSSMRKD